MVGEIDAVMPTRVTYPGGVLDRVLVRLAGGIMFLMEPKKQRAWMRDGARARITHSHSGNVERITQAK